MAPHIAPCGFDCTTCPVYRATAAGAPAALVSLWELWDPATRPATPEELRCAGCLHHSTTRIPFCASCRIRAAALENSTNETPALDTKNQNR